jgi:hypothetical protein
VEAEDRRDDEPVESEVLREKKEASSTVLEKNTHQIFI